MPTFLPLQETICATKRVVVVFPFTPVTLTIGTDTIVFTLNLPQLIEWPAPGDANGYRNIGLKFGGIPNNTQTTVMSILFNS